jgi:hypothetical protein
MRMKGVRIVVVAGIASIVGCQLFAANDAVQCRSDDDCHARGGDFIDTVCKDEVCATPGACYGNVVWKTADQLTKLRRKIRFLNSRLLPVPGAEVRVCEAFDPECNSPLATPTTDANGIVELPVYVGFRGSMQVRTAPPGFEGNFFPLVAYLYPPPEADELDEPTSEQSARITTRSEVDAVFEFGGITRLPGAGLLYVAVVDCNGKLARGVGITISDAGPSARPYYLDDTGLPSSTLTETSKQGVFTMVNLSVGRHHLEARSKNGIHGQLEIVTLADRLTFLVLPPTP